MPRDMREPKIRYSEKDGQIDYKDVALMQKFCSPQGKLYDRNRIGTSAKVQRRIANAVKRARFLGLLRYVGGR